MIETLAGLGRTMGFSFAAGINLYATVAILGLASRYGWVALPEQYRVFDNDWIIGGALIAIGTLGNASSEMKTLVALMGGTLAAGTHFTKAGTRAAVNTSPEPF